MPQPPPSLTATATCAGGTPPSLSHPNEPCADLPVFVFMDSSGPHPRHQRPTCTNQPPHATLSPSPPNNDPATQTRYSTINAASGAPLLRSATHQLLPPRHTNVSGRDEIPRSYIAAASGCRRGDTSATSPLHTHCVCATASLPYISARPTSSLAWGTHPVRCVSARPRATAS